MSKMYNFPDELVAARYRLSALMLTLVMDIPVPVCRIFDFCDLTSQKLIEPSESPVATSSEFFENAKDVIGLVQAAENINPFESYNSID